MKNDLQLLREFEPILHFTQGELFYPTAVDEYIKRCNLISHANNRPKIIAQAGTLTINNLAQYADTLPDQTLYLQFVQQPLDTLEYQRWQRRSDVSTFHAPGRLARVNLASRFVDSIFDASLLVRGTVPGGTTAAAHLQYKQMQAHDPRMVYYGRVVREGGYIILHYMFFYAMNNWRSTFYGANDHEADWEQVFVYLIDNDNAPPEPGWVAYASHDFSGDDLRRRWDDPLLLREGNHPVVFVGAGSHAAYYEQGEYLTNVQLSFFKPFTDLLYGLERFWANQLQQGDPDDLARRVDQFLQIPFIDYARGDGLRIGPNQDKEWSPIILNENTPWIDHYRGLWGYDTGDPFGGERAPAGPKFNRDGTVRLSWHNPLGWAGLLKVAPSTQSINRLRHHIIELEQKLKETEQEIAMLRNFLHTQELEVRALQETAYLERLHQKQQLALRESENKLNALYAHRSDLNDTLVACREYLSRIEMGDWGDPEAHITRYHHPQSSETVQHSRALEFWAATSSGLMLLAFAGFVLINPNNIFLGVAILLFVFTAIESTMRGQLVRFLLNGTIALAIITSLLLIKDLFWLIILVSLIGWARLLIVQNLRELRP